MPLPELIEIVPLASSVRAEITVPGSKSITNRALILAALAGGETMLRGALWSEDTEVMVACLRRLGFAVEVTPEADEPANRTMRVGGLGGKIPVGGTMAQPLELFVGNAGTAARFLAAMVCLSSGVYRLSGVPRMHERPQAALFTALRELGYRIDSPNDKLPAVIHGGGCRPARVTVGVGDSSQFASALLLSAGIGGWEVSVSGANDDELPYVEMTRELVKVFPAQGGEFQIEPDASSGSYFWAASWLLWIQGGPNDCEDQVKVRHWPKSGWQIDAEYPEYLKPPATISRKLDLGDSIMTAIIQAPLNRAPISQPDRQGQPIRFTDLGRLRVQECDRVFALHDELKKCGAHIEVSKTGDTLEIFPSDLHGATIDTYHDHRMAMCFATLGLQVPGIKLRNPACVKKTFPNFFQKLAAAPPHGLGAEIWACDPVTEKRTRILTGPAANPDDLFAA